jgi:hypothetical protein
MALYNILGQVLIKNMQIQNGMNEINLSTLAAGMYFCVFRSGDKVLRIEKILKAFWKYYDNFPSDLSVPRIAAYQVQEFKSNRTLPKYIF